MLLSRASGLLKYFFTILNAAKLLQLLQAEAFLVCLSWLLGSSWSSNQEDARMAIVEDDLVDPRHIKYTDRSFLHMAMIASNVKLEYDFGGKTSIVHNLGEQE
jgi:hypothetical protein